MFDAANVNRALDGEIARIEQQIEDAKAGAKDRMRNKLADLIAEIDGGVVCKMALKKHPTFEKEIR